MKPSNTIVVSTKYIENKEHQIADLSKKVEKLEKRLEDANKILWEVNDCRESREYYAELVYSYYEKWGIK